MAETEAQRAQRLQLMPMHSEQEIIPRLIPPMLVHLKRKGGIEVVSCDVYIGRTVNMGGWHLAQSKWFNPFTTRKHGTIDKVLELYEAHVRSLPTLMGDLHELSGKTMGCWCVPEPCHGDVLIKLFKEILADRL